MKLNFSILLFIMISYLSNFLYGQSNNIGIGTSNPDNSSILDLESTTQGLLAPRMTLSQRTSITSPANGLLVYQTDGVQGFYYYNGSSSTWFKIPGSSDGLFLPLTGGTMTGPINLNSYLLTNIGNAGTNFLSNGGLTLANQLTVTTGGLIVSAGGGNITGKLSISDSLLGNGYVKFSGISTGYVKSTNGLLSSSTSVNAASDMTGILPVGNGGTGVNSVTVNGLLYGNGSSAMNILTTANNSFLTTNGSGIPQWTSMSGGGFLTGTGSNNQIAYFTGSSILSSSNNFTWDGSKMNITGKFSVSDSLIGTGFVKFSGLSNGVVHSTSGVLSASSVQPGEISLATNKILIGNSSFNTANQAVFGGDISSSYTTGPTITITVNGIQNRAVANTLPLDKYLLKWNNSSTQWEPGQVDLTTNSVTGILPVANGGTGLNSSTANSFLTTNASNVITWSPLSGGSFITGSGAVNQIPYFTASSVLGGTDSLKWIPGGTGYHGNFNIGGNLTITDSTNVNTLFVSGLIHLSSLATAGIVRSTGGGDLSAGGAVQLGTTDVSGYLSTANGGLGSDFNQGHSGFILYGSGNNPIGSSSNFTYSNSHLNITGTGAQINLTGTATFNNNLSTDELAALKGVASINGAGVQNIGLWGAASDVTTANTGSIGLLASGNGNTTAGQTNVALQVSSGEFTMGRTTETGTGYSTAEAAAGGSAYTDQGPSGVIQITGNSASVGANSANILVNGVTVNNRYVNSSSIILLQVIGTDISGSITFATMINSRTSGAFTIYLTAVNGTGSTITIGSSNYIKVGYTIINPSK